MMIAIQIVLLLCMGGSLSQLQAQPDYTLKSTYRLFQEGGEASIWRDGVPL